jgi:hypothetical protein
MCLAWRYRATSAHETPNAPHEQTVAQPVQPAARIRARSGRLWSSSVTGVFSLQAPRGDTRAPTFPPAPTLLNDFSSAWQRRVLDVTVHAAGCFLIPGPRKATHQFARQRLSTSFPGPPARAAMDRKRPRQQTPNRTLAFSLRRPPHPFTPKSSRMRITPPHSRFSSEHTRGFARIARCNMTGVPGLPGTLKCNENDYRSVNS